MHSSSMKKFLALGNSALATIAKLAGGLIFVKIIALNLGPGGMGALGQFFSLAALLSVMCSGGVGSGITRYAAQNLQNNEVLCRVIQSASFICISSCLVIGLIANIFSRELSWLIFSTPQFERVIALTAFIAIPIGFSALGYAVINAFSATFALAMINLAAAALSGICLYILIAGWKLEGAALGVLWASGAASIFIGIWWIRSRLLNILMLIPRFDAKYAFPLFKYTFIALLSVLCHHGGQIIIRKWLVASAGWDEVGYWQAMVRLSDAYLQVINVFLMAYLLPKLSSRDNKSHSIAAIKESYALILPVLIIILVIGYLGRELIIDGLFSKDFRAVSPLFFPQMLGDFFKIVSYIPGYLLLARGYMPLLVAAEPVQMLLFLATSYWLADKYGAIGVCWAYFGTYFVYAGLSLSVFRRYAKISLPHHLTHL